VTRSGVDGIDVDVLGGKYNMSDIMAAIGLGQFANIDAITAHRRALARHYYEQFGRISKRNRRPAAAAGFR
jgi:dTDP-4-amino-4,6-dideoxygalactose transaminase